VILDERFLQRWLQAAGLQERLYLAFQRLPAQPERLERWDLWLELQEALLRTPFADEQEQELARVVQESGEGNLRVRALVPQSLRCGLQADFPGLRGAGAVLEAVRLAWAAVLSAADRPQELLSPAGRVSVQPEAPALQPAVSAPPCLPDSESCDPASGPDPCLLRLAELHNRLRLPGCPRGLQPLLDLRPWVDLAWAAPDADQEAQFLRAAEACGRREAAWLLERGRQAWAAWAASARAEETAGAPQPRTAKPLSELRFRQLAGASGAPGLASGPARLLRPGARGAARPGEILVCRRLPPEASAEALQAAGLLTEEGGSLSYGAVLALRANIPCVCGARGAPAFIRDGDLLVLDGRLGIAGIRPGRRSG